MERYKEYKDSGVKWIGEVPGNWEMRKVKFLSRYITDTSNNPRKIGLENIEGSSGKFIDSGSTFDGCGADVKVGDIVYGKLRPYLCKSWVATFDCNAVGDFCVFRSYADVIDNHYMNYMFLSNQFTGICNASTYGAKMPRVSPSFILGLPIPLPPLSEQRAIVRFLDDKCGKIDRVVESKSKEIALLKELRQSVIAEAVTRGINPNATLKNSNIPWIGEIPEGWEVKSLRNFIKLVSVKGHGDKQLLSVTREQGVIVRDAASNESNHNFIPDDLSNYKYVKPGQFVINKMKSWQGSYGVSEYEGIVSPAYYVCDLRFANKDFFSKAIRSKAYIPFFSQYSKGIRVDQWDLSPIALKTIPIIVPPIEEQTAIANYIDAKCARIDAAIAHLQAEIGHFKDYRQRLISDAVTGRFQC